MISTTLQHVHGQRLHSSELLVSMAEEKKRGLGNQNSHVLATEWNISKKKFASTFQELLVQTIVTIPFGKE